MSTILETIDGGTRYLEKRGVDDARTNMQLMVAHQLGCTRTKLYVDFDRPLAEENLAPLREMLKQRGEGTPLQHILGTVEFCGHDFHSDSRGLIPRPETEELVSLILQAELPPTARILDLGCGSGVIGLSLASALPESQVTLGDISTDALALTRKNAEALELKNVSFVESDLFQNISGEFDLIVSNPPYVPTTDRDTMAPELSHDPDLALFSGADGLDCLRLLIPAALPHLAPSGTIALEIGHDQARAVTDLLKSANYSDITVESDLNEIARFPFACRAS